MGYRVEFARPAQREYEKLDPVVKQRVADAVVELEKNPRPSGCVALKGYKAIYRIRIGKFRVIYEARDQVLLVLVVRIAKREDVYSDF
jgi:mRNA interferase RelE/StbE